MSKSKIDIDEMLLQLNRDINDLQNMHNQVTKIRMGADAFAAYKKYVKANPPQQGNFVSKDMDYFNGLQIHLEKPHQAPSIPAERITPYSTVDAIKAQQVPLNGYVIEYRSKLKMLVRGFD